LLVEQIITICEKNESRISPVLFILASDERNENLFSFRPSGVETKSLMPRRSVADAGPKFALGLIPFILLYFIYAIQALSHRRNCNRLQRYR
jgi:hypothetical protein